VLVLTRHRVSDLPVHWGGHVSDTINAWKAKNWPVLSLYYVNGKLQYQLSAFSLTTDYW